MVNTQRPSRKYRYAITLYAFSKAKRNSVKRNRSDKRGKSDSAQRHTNFAFTGPLRASTGRSQTLRQTDKSACLSGSWKLV